MPRTKTNPDELYVRELRITPPDGKPIEDWKVTEKDFKQVLACQEGGTPECRLHYHVYIESLRSESWIKKWVYSIAHCYNGEQGNTVWFSRKPHDNTIGYVVKHGNVVVRHGCTQSFIDEWMAKSEEYRRTKEAQRKRTQRVEKAFTHQVRDNIAGQLQTRPELRNTRDVLNMILLEYHCNDKVFPNRSTVENLTATLLYPYDDQLVSAFYLRGFDSLYRT